MKKSVAIIIILLIAFAIPVLCAAIGLAPAVAEEDNIVEYHGIVDDTHKTVFKNEVCWKTDVYILETGDILSYFDDHKLRLGSPLKLKVFNGDEVIDVEYSLSLEQIITTILAIIILIAILWATFHTVNKRCP
jgi:hypothetical protein